MHSLAMTGKQKKVNGTIFTKIYIRITQKISEKVSLNQDLNKPDFSPALFFFLYRRFIAKLV